jgi:hypothetical protein
MDPRPSRRGWLFGMLTAGLASWLTPRPDATAPPPAPRPPAQPPVVSQPGADVTGKCYTFVYDACGPFKQDWREDGGSFDYNGLK